MTQSNSSGNALITLKEKEASWLLKVGPSPPPSTNDARSRISWDEKGRTKLVQMFISYGDRYINSIAFQYIEDGHLVISPIFGSRDLHAPNFVTLMLDAANEEYVTSLGGSWRNRDYSTVAEGITSLTIETNLATYGPFGNPGPKDPHFNLCFGPENQFGGFHGTTYEDILTSIGVYVKPIYDLTTLFKKTELHVQ